MLEGNNDSKNFDVPHTLDDLENSINWKLIHFTVQSTSSSTVNVMI